MTARLEKHGYKCSFVALYEEARSRLSLQSFDLVLSPMRVRNDSFFPLVSLLEGSHTTLFFFQAVEDGCWWLPALESGRRCFGSSALRPSEFIAALEKIRDGIYADAREPAEHAQSLLVDRLEHDDFGDRSLQLMFAEGLSLHRR